MSIGEFGMQVQCDGEDCEALASLPIALRPQLLEATPDSDATGWLFISCNGPHRHFCPRCATTQLDRISERRDEAL